MKNLEERSRPVKMDISAAAAVDTPWDWTPEEYSNWYAAGCPDDEPEPTYAEEPTPTLDAVGKGGKGKGKGKTGKGYGNWKGGNGNWGGGKGNDWNNKGGKGKGKENGKGAGTWVEKRACHNCGEVGHLAWQCTQPKKGKGGANSVDGAALARADVPAARQPGSLAGHAAAYEPAVVVVELRGRRAPRCLV